MADKKRPNDDDRARRRDDVELNPFPGITGEGAEPTTSFGDPDEGILEEGLHGMIDDPRDDARSRAVGASTRPDADPHRMTSGTSISPISDVPDLLHGGRNDDVAGQMKQGQGAQVAGNPQGGMGGGNVGGMGTGTGRGRGSGQPGGVYGGGDSAGTGGMGGGLESQIGTGGMGGGLGNDVGGGLTGSTGSLPHPSDQTATGGGVAVSAGRGSDLGTTGGGMEQDLSANTTGGMSGGSFGGSRESDLGGGLSGGMRSGMGKDVSGGVGGSDDEEAEGDQQRSPRRKEGR
jgi:hypothetical protein